MAVKYAPKEMVKMNEASGKSIGSGSIIVTASGESLLAVKKRKELERARSKAMLMNFFNPFC